MGWKWVDEGDGAQPNSAEPDGQATQQILNARQAGNMSVNTVAGGNQFAQEQQAQISQAQQGQAGGLGLYNAPVNRGGQLGQAPASGQSQNFQTMVSQQRAMNAPAQTGPQVGGNEMAFQRQQHARPTGGPSAQIGSGLFQSNAAQIAGSIPAPGAANANQQGRAASEAAKFGQRAGQDNQPALDPRAEANRLAAEQQRRLLG